MRLLAVLLVLQLGCYAPRGTGAERTTYITLATFDMAVVGAIGGLTGCLFATRGGTSPNRIPQSSRTRRMRLSCAIAGAVPTGTISLYGSLEAEREPDSSAWIAVSTMAVTGTLWLLANAFMD